MRACRSRCLVMLAFLGMFTPGWAASADAQEPVSTPDLLDVAVQRLLKGQGASGEWTYVIPTLDDFHVANTSIVAQALLFAAPTDKEAQAAVQRALTYVLKQIQRPEMKQNGKIQYVRFTKLWSCIYATEFLCHVRARKMDGEHAKEVDEGISLLVKMLLEEELPAGSWNYYYAPQDGLRCLSRRLPRFKHYCSRVCKARKYPTHLWNGPENSWKCTARRMATIFI